MPMTSPEDLGKAIAHLRGDRTQAEVARLAGLDPTTWSFYETGRRRPKEANFEKLLRGLGCERIELEAMAWEIRKRRLLEEQDAARRAGSPRFVKSAMHLAEALAETRKEPTGDPFRRDLRDLLAHVAILVEEVLVLMTRHGPPRQKEAD